MTDPGNNLNSALDVGNLSDLQTFNDAVNASDRDDFYKFNLTQTSNFNLNMSGLTDNASVYLIADLNQNGVVDRNETLEEDTYNTSTNDGVIKYDLGAGNYFAWITTPNTDDNTNYTLKLSAIPTPPTTPANPGNDLSSALNIGNLNGQKIFKDFVGVVDPQDFYRFSLAQTSNLTLNMTGISDYASVYLIADTNKNGVVDNNETIEEDTYNTSTNDGVIKSDLGAGNYFALIKPNNFVDNTNYTLNLSAVATPATTPSNPGNDLSSALNIGNLSGQKTFKDFVGVVDPQDFYRFSLTQNSHFTLNMSGLSDNAGVYLIADLNKNGVVDNNETFAEDSYNTSTNNGAIESDLGVGNYFVLIKPSNVADNSNYTLNLSAIATPPTTPSNPGNDLNSAFNLGNLSSPKNFKDFVGVVDRADVYRFNITQISDFSLNMTGLTDRTDVYLIADLDRDGVIDNNETIAQDTYNSGTNDGIINYSNLGAGTYFALIRPYSDEDNSNYNLRLSAITKTPSNNDDYIIGTPDNENIDALAGNDYLESRSGNDSLIGGSGNDNLVGEEDNDTLVGGDGNDRLDGGFGDNSLTGGIGDDTYSINGASDNIVEQANQGKDTVISTVNYSLGGTVENLTLKANYVDALTGQGNSLNNVLTGNQYANTLKGGAGNDSFIGGKGKDTLTGGSGSDRFIFKSISDRVDIITDFATEDTIVVSAASFKGGLTAGTLKPEQFVLGTSAQDSGDRFIYNSNNGALFFDSDGNGSLAAQHIATLSNKFPITNADILVI
jgi:RTX calcium-binding nonapeptide repeat (4 copies)